MSFLWESCHLYITDSFHVKRAAPQGPFEHRCIKEVILKTVFVAGRGSECLADAPNVDEYHAFNPVRIKTIALAATAV